MTLLFENNIKGCAVVFLYLYAYALFWMTKGSSFLKELYLEPFLELLPNEQKVILLNIILKAENIVVKNIRRDNDNVFLNIFTKFIFSNYSIYSFTCF